MSEHTFLHLLEENALVSSVLIDEDEARSVFHEDVAFAEDTEKTERILWRRGRG